MSISNDMTGLGWLRKAFKSRKRRAHLGLGSWAGTHAPKAIAEMEELQLESVPLYLLESRTF
jgi:hypothetical protein